MTEVPPDDALVSVREGARLAGMSFDTFRKRLQRGSRLGTAVFTRFGRQLVRRSDCLQLRQADAMRGRSRGE